MLLKSLDAFALTLCVLLMGLLTTACQNPVSFPQVITAPTDVNSNDSRALNTDQRLAIVEANIDKYFAEHYYYYQGRAHIKMVGEGNTTEPYVSTSEAMGYGMRLALYGARLAERRGNTTKKQDYERKFNYLFATVRSVSKNYKNYIEHDINTVEDDRDFNYNDTTVRSLFPVPANESRTAYSIQANWWIPPKVKQNLAYIMHRQFAEEKSQNYTIGPATDGDMDITYALILSDTLGYNGGQASDRRDMALRYIRGIIDYYYSKVDAKNSAGATVSIGIVGNGIWTKNITRPSDWMLHHLRTFNAYFNRYGPAAEKSIVSEALSSMIAGTEFLIKENRWGKGLFPDFIEFVNGDYRPLPLFAIGNSGPLYAAFKDLGEETDPHRYHYNACRVPWRLSEDYNLRVTGADYANFYTGSGMNSSSPYLYSIWNVMPKIPFGIKSCYDISTGLPVTVQNPACLQNGDDGSAINTSFFAPVLASIRGAYAVTSSRSKFQFNQNVDTNLYLLNTTFNNSTRPDQPGNGDGYYEDSVNLFSQLLLINEMPNAGAF